MKKLIFIAMPVLLILVVIHRNMVANAIKFN